MKKSNMITDLNVRLRQLREDLKKKQKEMAEILGITSSFYSDLETGKRPITGKMIERLVASFDVSADWMLMGTGNMYLSRVPQKGKNVSRNVPSNVPNVEEWFEKLPYEVKLEWFKNSIKTSGNQNIIFIQKFTEDLRKERPDLADMKYLYSELAAFSIDLENIYKAYIEPGLSSKIKGTELKNYQDYKEKNIKHLELFLPYKSAIEPVVKALRKLVKDDFPPMDDKGVLLPDNSGSD